MTVGSTAGAFSAYPYADPLAKSSCIEGDRKAGRGRDERGREIEIFKVLHITCNITRANG